MKLINYFTVSILKKMKKYLFIQQGRTVEVNTLQPTCLVLVVCCGMLFITTREIVVPASVYHFHSNFLLIFLARSISYQLTQLPSFQKRRAYYYRLYSNMRSSVVFFFQLTQLPSFQKKKSLLLSLVFKYEELCRFFS